MRALELLVRSMLDKGPKIGRRFLAGQVRCTEIGEHGQQVDRSELRNSLTVNKYRPHQGQREMERRRARGGR